MGREATKASGNPWYEARKKAALYDDRLKSREGAAEQLGMSVSSVAEAELGMTKCMPADKLTCFTITELGMSACPANCMTTRFWVTSTISSSSFQKTLEAPST